MSGHGQLFLTAPINKIYVPLNNGKSNVLKVSLGILNFTGSSNAKLDICIVTLFLFLERMVRIYPKDKLICALSFILVHTLSTVTEIPF